MNFRSILFALGEWCLLKLSDVLFHEHFDLALQSGCGRSKFITVCVLLISALRKDGKVFFQLKTGVSFRGSRYSNMSFIRLYPLSFPPKRTNFSALQIKNRSKWFSIRRYFWRWSTWCVISWLVYIGLFSLKIISIFETRSSGSWNSYFRF